MSHEGSSAKPQDRAPQSSEELLKSYFQENFGVWVGFVQSRFSLPREDSEDVVMNAFREASAKDWTRSEDARNQLGAFMGARVKWRARDTRTSKARRQQCEVACDATEIHTVPDSELAQPERMFAEQEKREQAVLVIQQLSSRDQQHASLVLAGLTPQECARELGLEEGTERVRRHRWMSRITKIVQQGGEEQR
ncbi:RNA polymerase sigma factor [Streptomyces sp. NPDC102365]|uniref:RNA polymerase sigma factor n=1 Tax=Streptomyces sp. NPDC102365 TaxID=3366162 RepID=UPI00380137F6